MANTKITSANLDTLTTLTVDDITIDGSTISDSGDLTLDVGGDIVLDAAGGDIILKNAGSTNGNIVLGDATSPTITISSGFNFTLDIGANIILDADGGEIQLKDGGTTFAELVKSGNDFRINQGIQDGDIVFRGNDGGSVITALTLDMSASGQILGIANTPTNPTYSFANDTNTGITRPTGDTLTIVTGGTERSRTGSTGKVSWSAGGIGAVATQDRDFTFYTEGSTNGIDIRSNDYRNILLGAGGSSGVAMDSGYIGLYKDGNSKIGINASGNSFILADSGSIPNSTSTNLFIQDTTALAAGVGGSIVFSGIYTGSTQLNNGPYIKAFKTNATDGDYGFGLRFAIRENGSSQKTGMEISSTGEVSKPLQPYTAAYRSSNQTVSAVTWTDWSVDTTLEHNQASSMRTATSTFTMPVAGVYLCTGVISIQQVSATNYALARVVFSSHNDVELGIFEQHANSSNSVNDYGYDVPINFMFKAVSGETMKVQTFSGSGTHVVRGGAASHIEIMLMG